MCDFVCTAASAYIALVAVEVDREVGRYEAEVETAQVTSGGLPAMKCLANGKAMSSYGPHMPKINEATRV